jgi:hypothetical protein
VTGRAALPPSAETAVLSVIKTRLSRGFLMEWVTKECKWEPPPSTRVFL